METAEKQNSNYATEKYGYDCFAGEVAIFEDLELKKQAVDARFWVEQQRKDVYTDFLTIDAAQAKYDEFINDTMF